MFISNILSILIYSVTITYLKLLVLLNLKNGTLLQYISNDVGVTLDGTSVLLKIDFSIMWMLLSYIAFCLHTTIYE